MKTKHYLLFAMAIVFSICTRAQQDGFIGEIRMFAGNFAPRGWEFCNGQILQISTNSALFSILGTTYGGDGRTTFALPDLRGRVAVSAGQSNGTSFYNLGQTGGAETHTLTIGQLPAHNHALQAVNETGNNNSPGGNYPAGAGFADVDYSSGTPNTQMNPAVVQPTGSNQAVNHVMPYTAVNYIICVDGTFPSRN